VRHDRRPLPDGCAPGGISLPTFTVLLRHERFATPSLHLVTAVNEAMAQEIADELLDDSPDCIGVEVWEGDRRLYVRGSVAGGAEGSGAGTRRGLR
jgi:hypothetical protein